MCQSETEVCDWIDDWDETSHLRWNKDPAWAAYISKFEAVISQIAAKYTLDDDLREDCAQEARIALLTIYPEKVDGFEKYVLGEVNRESWNNTLDAYCRVTIRNTIISLLTSTLHGNPYVGRTKTVLDKETGERKKVHQPPRMTSLDDFEDCAGLQIDTEGGLAWGGSTNLRGDEDLF